MLQAYTSSVSDECASVSCDVAVGILYCCGRNFFDIARAIDVLGIEDECIFVLFARLIFWDFNIATVGFDVSAILQQLIFDVSTFNFSCCNRSYRMQHQLMLQLEFFLSWYHPTLVPDVLSSIFLLQGPLFTRCTLCSRSERRSVRASSWSHGASLWHLQVHSPHRLCSNSALISQTRAESINAKLQTWGQQRQSIAASRDGNGYKPIGYH